MLKHKIGTSPNMAKNRLHNNIGQWQFEQFEKVVGIRIT